MNSQGASRLEAFTVGGEINESIFTPSFQLRSGAKRWVSTYKEVLSLLLAQTT